MIERWPLRQALAAALVVSREEHLRQFNADRLFYAMLAPHVERGALDYPDVPDVLKESARVRP